MLILVRAEWLSLRKASEDLQIDTGLERQTGPGPGHGCWHRAASAVYQAALLQHTCASSLTHALRARPQEELQVECHGLMRAVLSLKVFNVFRTEARSEARCWLRQAPPPSQGGGSRHASCLGPWTGRVGERERRS